MEIRHEVIHHDQTANVQNAFRKDVCSLGNVMEELGNPFEEESEDLFVLPHISRGLCTEVQPSCTCHGFCNHSWFLLSSPTPSQLVMATQGLVAVSSPRYDHPGSLLSWHAPNLQWPNIHFCSQDINQHICQIWCLYHKMNNWFGMLSYAAPLLVSTLTEH